MIKKLMKMRIQKRLTASTLISIAITGLAAVIALIAMISISLQYRHVLTYYAFPQGDIGHAMAALADMRSATRGVIGYDDQEKIDKMKTSNEENRQKLEEYLSIIEESVVTEVGQQDYEQIVAAIDEYKSVEDEIIALGATEDTEQSLQAQQEAFDKLAPAYTNAYGALQDFMDENVQLGDSSSQTLMETLVILAIAVLAALIAAVIIAIRIGRVIAHMMQMMKSGIWLRSYPVLQISCQGSSQIWSSCWRRWQMVILTSRQAAKMLM